MPAETADDANRMAGTWTRTIILIILAIGAGLLGSLLDLISQAR